MGGLWSNAANAINSRESKINAELRRQLGNAPITQAQTNPGYAVPPGGVPLAGVPQLQPTQLGAGSSLPPRPAGPLTRFGRALGSTAYDLTPNFMRPNYSQGN